MRGRGSQTAPRGSARAFGSPPGPLLAAVTDEKRRRVLLLAAADMDQVIEAAHAMEREAEREDAGEEANDDFVRARRVSVASWRRSPARAARQAATVPPKRERRAPVEHGTRQPQKLRQGVAGGASVHALLASAMREPST
jgi:hypothetical protein